MNNDNDGGSTVFLGLVLFGFFVWMLSKIATVVFVEISKLFEAIGNAAMSFFGMAWAIAQLAGIIGFGVLLVYAVYKFILLVKNSTAIIEQFEYRSEDFLNRLATENDETVRKLNRQVYQMRVELSEALKEPEAAPPVQPVAELPAQAVTQTEQQPKDMHQSSVSVSNPY